MIYFHLPGLFEFYDFYSVFLSLFKEHREYFYDWCEIGSIYGAPVDCLWGGGRAGFGECNAKVVLKLMNEYNISPRLTFSNSLLREEHLSDKRCNDLCEMFYKEVSDNLAKKLFVLLARADKSSVSDLSAMRYKEQFLGIRAAVHANYTADCRVEDMARLANMSMSRFFTIYKQIFGISPQKDLNNSRLQRAKIMLSNSSYSVEKISELVGFNNQYHFIRQFKKSTGMSPGQYRKMQKN